jgi:phage N-6-adenine-methyltransferase
VANELKKTLDAIDDAVKDAAFSPYMKATSQIKRGMWDKGRAILEKYPEVQDGMGGNPNLKQPRGGDLQVVTYSFVAEETGRNRQDIKKWVTIARRLTTKKAAEEWIEEEAQKQTEKYIANKPDMAHVGYNSGNNEWYTPAEYVDAAREVMGTIDLDPASSEKANEVVKADKFFTSEDDAFEQDWTGKVFMNPPYSSDLIKPFCEKYSDEIANGHIEEGVVLVNNATDTAWFLLLAATADAACFTTGRIHFWSPTKDTSAPLQGQAILYSGKNVKGFVEKFKEFGHVWEKANLG